MAGILGSVFAEIGRAFEDARHKMVEEGWFGRQVTDRDLPQSGAEELGWKMPRQSFDEAWAPADRAHEPQQDGPEHNDPGIDR